MSFLVTLLIVVGVVVLTLGALRSAKRDAPESLDLATVQGALIEKQGWSLERAEAARVEYVRFLTLLQGKPAFMLVPWTTPEGQDDLDQFWHQHILDTEKYAADCQRLFGRMIHHSPHVVRGSGQETDAVARTQQLYARTFAAGPYGQPIDTAWLSTDGGSFAAFDGDSHSHSHSDGGHGDGGHSDGGHSCGGHSCGHGCGGH